MSKLYEEYRIGVRTDWEKREEGHEEGPERKSCLKVVGVTCGLRKSHLDEN